MRALKTFLFLVILCGGTSHAQSISYIEKINSILNTFKGDTALQHAGWGFCLISDKSGETVASLDEKRSLQPASTTKILTTGAALSILGGDYTFKTRLAYKGTISKQGVLNGDVYIIGGGDPTLGFNRIPGVKDENQVTDAFEIALRKAGIKKIQGRIIADASHYEKAMQPNAWAWDDIANYYGAGPSGLNFRENQYNLYLKQGKNPGDSTKFSHTYPSIPDFVCYDDILSGPRGCPDNGYIYGAPYTCLRYLRGTIPPGDTLFCIKGSLPDPALLCAQMLAARFGKDAAAPLATTYYLLDEKKQTPDTSARKLVLTLASPPLRQIVMFTNLLSINLYAESLLKEIGKKVNGKGSTEEGLRVLKKFWQDRGVNLGGLFLLDGSGLSRYDAITAEQFATAMHQMRNDKAYKDFYASLPVAGVSGSLFNIGKGTPAQENMRAKSGYMTRVMSYAGYVRSKEGQDFSFSFIINNYSESAYSVKMKIEKLLVALSE